MRRLLFKRLLAVVALLLMMNTVSGQEYFDFYCGNVPPGPVSYFSSVEIAKGWLYYGRYSEHASRLSENSIIKKEDIDSLHRKYMDIYPGAMRKAYIPRIERYEKGNRNDLYLIHTMYEIRNKVPFPIFQVEVTFSKIRPNEKNDVLNIIFVKGDSLRKYDKKMLMTAYKKQMQEEATEVPPPMNNLKH